MSFVFAPTAFAKPQKVRLTSSQPGYLKVVKTLRSNKKGVKVSTLMNSASDMIGQNEFANMKSLALPYWGQKFDTAKIGKDYFKFSFKGKTIFGRYVDRGPVALIVNNKPVLWKDFVQYGSFKKRMGSILGIPASKKKRVSFIDHFLSEMWPKAFADSKESCAKTEGTTYDDATKICYCSDGSRWDPSDACLGSAKPNPEPDKDCSHKPGTEYSYIDEACTCSNGNIWGQKKGCGDDNDDRGRDDRDDYEDDEGDEELPAPPKKKRFDWKKILLIGGIVGAGVLLWKFLKKRRNKRRKPNGTLPPPIVGWTPEPENPLPPANPPVVPPIVGEGTCTTDGARGLPASCPGANGVYSVPPQPYTGSGALE